MLKKRGCLCYNVENIVFGVFLYEKNYFYCMYPINDYA